MPSIPIIKSKPCPNSLSEAELAAYERDGFLSFSQVLTSSEVESAKAALSQLVETMRRNHRTLKNPSGDIWRSRRHKMLIQFEPAALPGGRNEPDLESKVRKFSGFVDVEPYLTNLARNHPKIQSILANLIGAQSRLIANMALVKPAHVGSSKEWHQDDAYHKIVPLEAVCGVWIALDDADVENGCMHFLPGWHKRGPLRHFRQPGQEEAQEMCQILPDRLLLEEQVAMPIPAGGALFFLVSCPTTRRLILRLIAAVPYNCITVRLIRRWSREKNITPFSWKTMACPRCVRRCDLQVIMV